MTELLQSPDFCKRKRGRSKYGCLTCRTKRVKCDETLPSCGRCVRLQLACEQPCSRILPSLQERRRGIGSWKSRESDIHSLKPILPNAMQSQDPNSMSGITAGANVERDGYHSDVVMSWPIDSSSPDTMTSPSCALATHPFIAPSVDWLLPPLQEFDVFLPQALSPQVLSTPQPIEAVILENGELLTDEERRTLVYFRTLFSVSQTTRDPQWSVTSLLVEHGLQNSEMLLRLILAVSLQDSQNSGEVSPQSYQAQRNYEIGAQKLAFALQRDESLDHVEVLGCLYCVYAYMARQNPLVLSRIDGLSHTILDYIQKHRLVVLVLNADQTTSTSRPANTAARKDQSLIARLIMWLFKIDAQCGFLGCRSSLLEYFRSRTDALEAFHAASRLALQLNWGKRYPISQSIRDIESSMSVDLMADLMLISYRINYSSQTSTEPESQFVALEKDLNRLETKYGTVFYYGSSEMTLQPAMKLNCAVAATMFYATKLFLLRSPPSRFGEEGCPEVSHALGKLLVFAKHVCIEGFLQPVYEFQWPLFLACVETNDLIHQEWLESRICDARLQRAVALCLSAKKDLGGEIDLHTIRTILTGRL